MYNGLENGRLCSDGFILLMYKVWDRKKLHTHFTNREEVNFCQELTIEHLNDYAVGYLLCIVYPSILIRGHDILVNL